MHADETPTGTPSASVREPLTDTPRREVREPLTDTPRREVREPVTDSPGGDARERVTDTPGGYVREPVDADPPLDHPPYRSTAHRHPKRPLVYLPHTLTEITGPQLSSALPIDEHDSDLTRQHAGEPVGERIIVGGRVLDTDGKPLRNTLVEIWQANGAGRYAHGADRWPAPLDPNFSGAGRCTTDEQGRYRFTTIKPGAYPWGNGQNVWRPAHIHFSLLGRAFAQRLVTQMYFAGDPLLALDPIFNSVRDPKGRERLLSRLSTERSQDHWALWYEFDIYLRGPDQTPFEAAH
jgi:protocatechuate 3,4-dioxygenase, beta subunit